MLSLKQIGGGKGGLNTAAAAAYYEGEARQALSDRMAEARAQVQRDPSKAADDYLMGDPSAPLATWWSAAGKLAPDGAPIVPGQLRDVLDGKGLDGSPLVKNQPGRVAGYDLTFSAPKPVAVLWATGSPEVRRYIAESMAASARAGLQALQDRGVFVTRRGAAGKVREPAEDVAAALFPQFTSRTGDPQAHVHAVLPNVGRRGDGKTGALDVSGLFFWKTYSGAVFRAELARRMERLGVAILEDGQAFTVAGVPDRLVAAWSKRRAAVVDALDRVRAQIERAGEAERAAATAPGVRQGPLRDSDPGEAGEDTRGKRLRLLKERLTQATRRAKDTVPGPGQLEERWTREMEALGLSREAVWRAVREAARGHQRPKNSPELAAIAEALERSAVVTERTLRRMVAEASQTRGGGADGAHAAFARAVVSGDLIPLEKNRRGEQVFSTQATLERERRMLLDALERRGEGSHFKPDAVAAAIAARPTLSPEQAAAVRHAARPDGVVVVEGAAGAGKSFALSAMVDAAQRSGARVVGLAPSWEAADVVRQEARLPGSRALQGFVRDLEAGRVRFGSEPAGGAEPGVRYLGQRVVLVVDEAGMAGSSDLAALLRHAREGRAQVLLQGDRRQLQSVEPGAPFAAVADALGVARMEDVRRQTGWQREASKAFASGDSVEGLARYEARGRVRWARDAEQAVQRTADAWEKNRAANPDASRLVLAARNADVHALNREIRGRLLAAGELGAEAITVRTLHAGGRRGAQGEARDMELRTGDRLALGVTLAKIGRDVLANDVATLERVQPGADPLLTLRLDRTGKTETLRLSELAMPAGKREERRPRLPILQHAYARTIHKSQGRTVDFTIVHAGDGLDASRAYVAMTRHRRDVLVVANAGAIARRLAEQGEKPTQEAVRVAFLRSAKADSDGKNAADYVADRATWLRTGDPKALPETVQQTRWQAAAQFARVAVAKAGAAIRWRPERLRPVVLQRPPEPAQRPEAPGGRAAASTRSPKPRGPGQGGGPKPRGPGQRSRGKGMGR